MTGRRRAAIVGVAESEVGRTPHLTVLSQQARASKKALTEAGLRPQDVNALFVAGNWSWAPALTLAEYLGLRPEYLDGTNIGGSSFEAHLGHATAAIEAGLIDNHLRQYPAQQPLPQRPQAARNTDRPVRPAFGLPQPVGAYALAANRYFHQYGASGEQLAEVAVSARQWAALNPDAYHRDPITVDDVLGSPMISDPLHLLDCCPVTDGGGAVVVAAEDRWPDVDTHPVEVLGHGETTTHSSIAQMPDLTVTGAAHSGPAAMKMAGITHDDLR